MQRFQGRPSTGFDSLGNTGVTYRDVPLELTNGSQGANIYGPRIADLNIFTNGHLSGAPVQFFTKIHDDFNPPESGPFGAFPFGTSTPIGSWSVLGGARSQHVFRATDASPDWLALAGTKLDLYHASYAPIGGFVTNTTIPDISVHVGHTSIVPDTRQNLGLPSHQHSGLRQVLAENYDAVEAATGVAHQRQLVVGTEIAPGRFQGVPYEISNTKTYSPLGSPNVFHPIPDQPFSNPFVYNNGLRDVVDFNTTVASQGGGYGTTVPTWPSDDKYQGRPQSLLMEYRVRVVDVMNPPAQNNGFTFAVGILSTALPRFRVFSFGAGCMSCCLQNGTGTNNCMTNCMIQYGPALNSPSTTPTGYANGGLPLEPDAVTHAAGPAPQPPGMPCVCLASPANQRVVDPSCVQDNTQRAITIDLVATGAAALPTDVNFGDNSRYFMLFDYIKRESYIISPFVRVQPANVNHPTYHAPIFDPPLDAIAEGTSVEIRLRSSLTGVEGTATSWVTPLEMANPDNPINTEANSGPFLQFDAVLISNTTTQIAPIFDDIVVPVETGL